jgi:hypothetical protein
MSFLVGDVASSEKTNDDACRVVAARPSLESCVWGIHCVPLNGFVMLFYGFLLI